MIKMAKYLEIAEKIKRKIHGNIYKENEMLPSEKMLGNMYSVSRLTVRKALEELEEDGYINIKAGKGSFVSRFSNDIYKLNLEIDNIINCGYDEVELLSAKMIIPDINLVYHLMVKPGSRIVCINWLLIKNEQPIAFETRYMPYSNGLVIEESDLTYTNLVDMVCKKFLYYEYKESIVIKGIIPDDSLKDYLEISHYDSTAFVLIEHKVFNENGRPLGYSKLRINSKYCEIKGSCSV